MKNVLTPDTLRDRSAFKQCDPPNAQDNETELESLYQRHARELVWSLRKAFGDGPPDPEDIAQAAFEKLAQQDVSGIRNLKAFLWRTARNLTLTYKRDSASRSRFDFEIEQLYFAAEGPESNPQRVLEVQQQLNIIDEALEQMPEKRKRAFLLHRVDGLSFAAIGRRMGLSPRAVVKHIARAVGDIEDALLVGTERDQ